MDRLFQEKKKNVNRIIDNFAEAKTKVSAFCDTMYVLQNELRIAETNEEFDNLVQRIINEVKKVHSFLSQLTKGADKEIMSKVMAHMNRHPHFKNIVTLLNYSETVTKDIIAKKELLSLKEALSDLNDEQKAALLFYVKKLKELKPIGGLLVNQEDEFKDRLHRVTSLDALDEIEIEVQNKNQLLDGALERLLPYPEDEVVASRIIEFLKINGHLLAILKSFNLHETLMDDILNVRAKIIAANEVPAFGAP